MLPVSDGCPSDSGSLSSRLRSADAEPSPSDNLYVWQLPQECTDDFLRELFQQCGTVLSVKTVADRRYGFVRFASVEEAAFAMSVINGLQCHGTTLRIKYADQSKGTGFVARAVAASEGGAQRMESEALPGDNLYVWQLPVGSDESFIQQLFEQVGTVVSVKCVPEKRYGFVRFSTVEDATAALKTINGLHCHGTTIRIKYADNQRGVPKDALVLAGLGTAALADVVGKPSTQSVQDIRVEGLPHNLMHADVDALFAAYARGAKCKVIRNDGETLTALIGIANLSDIEWLLNNLDGNIPQGLTTPVRISLPQARGVPSLAHFSKASARTSRSSPYGDSMAERSSPTFASSAFNKGFR